MEMKLTFVLWIYRIAWEPTLWLAKLFAGLEKIVEGRAGKSGVGFNAPLRTAEEREASDTFADVMPEDLLKFGLIPEFIGRLPVITSVSNLDKKALIQILTEPKNALVRQYKKMFEMEECELDFTPGALREIARLARIRETGARGLRSILEDVMFELMYELPELERGQKFMVTEEIVRGDRKIMQRDSAAA